MHASDTLLPPPVGSALSPKETLLEKISNTTAKVAIIGMGYVGVPLATCIAKLGFPVTGIDLNTQRVQQINQGKSYIADIADDELAPLVQNGKIQAVDHFDVISDMDVVIICVPTPLTKNREPDISYIQSASKEIAKRLRSGQLITLESTTYPGTTEEVLLPLLKNSGLEVGQDFFIAHSPERVDPGNARYTTHNTNKVIGGYTEACREVAAAFYRKSILEIISVSSPGCAEMVKVFENTFRAVNIALVNELALLCDKMGLNVWEVVQAASTKPFGMLTFWPGPGVGGHCIPIDPFYLTWKAHEYNFHTRFIELAGEINSNMPQFVREKIIRALGKQGKPLYGSKVMLLGVAYKRDLGDWRQSPGLDLLHVLQNDDVELSYHDPHVPQLEDKNGQVYQSVALTEEALKSVDCVVLITDHSAFDYHFITEHAPMIVDTRNACQHVLDQREKIILL
jgi:UDP-N-acetyl-D-glucosamine dehydrogenase